MRNTILGIDADGFPLPGTRAGPHLAAINGFIGDTLLYETRPTPVKMAFKAHREKPQAQKVDFVVTPNRYCGEQLDKLYPVRNSMFIPKLIDMDSRSEQSRENPSPTSRKHRLIVRCVCRLCSRNGMYALLRAAALLRARFPQVERRTVRGGNLRLFHCDDLGGIYSLTEPGFGLVTPARSVYPAFRNDLASFSFRRGRSASRLSRRTHVLTVRDAIRHRLLAEPENNGLADPTEKLDREPQLRTALTDHGRCHAERFALRPVARCLMETARKEIKKWRR